mgnify:CR=1 FL=1
MIAYVKGKVIDEFDGGVVLENNGIGYEILCSATAAAKLSANKEGAVYTYFQLRDDGVSLYGFDNKAEKAMFIKLISVSGVGPKLGISVLSGMSLTDLATAIATSDVKSLSRIKGLGKKTAERIVLELREKISADEDGVLISPVGATNTVLSSEDEDAVIALTELGFSLADSRKAVQKAKEAGAKTAQEVISAALRSM